MAGLLSVVGAINRYPKHRGDDEHVLTQCLDGLYRAAKGSNHSKGGSITIRRLRLRHPHYEVGDAEMRPETAAILILALMVVALVAVLWWLIRSIPAREQKARADERKAFQKRSGRTRLGNTVEHYVPFLKDFPYDPSDARFISGGPIDYAVFDGLTDGQIREVVLLDVKTDDAQLSKEQRQVRRCLIAGRFGFAEFQVSSSGSATLKRRRSGLHGGRVFEPVDDKTVRRLGPPQE